MYPNNSSKSAASADMRPLALLLVGEHVILLVSLLVINVPSDLQVSLIVTLKEYTSTSYLCRKWQNQDMRHGILHIACGTK